NVMHRRFCPKCGTHVFAQSEARPHLMSVRAGTLDEPGDW
ncbi:MAG TPA: aldehyde-activating protein, partial [Rhizobiales bacterium]|nr:aldehyde-activating protein [Hyphomicrobiales bacterium]